MSYSIEAVTGLIAVVLVRSLLFSGCIIQIMRNPKMYGRI